MDNNDIDKLKIITYKINIGDYDYVSPPPERYVNNPNVEFILFTSGEPVKGWKTIKVPNGGIRESRYLKINSHLLREYTNFQYDYSIYADACLEFDENFIHNLFLYHSVSNKFISIQEHQDYLFEHCEKMKRLRKHLMEPITRQMKKYESLNFRMTNVVTWENCFIVRPNNDICEAINEEWWKQFSLDDSARDQISLPYVINTNRNFKINNLMLKVREKNDVFSNWCKHGSTSKKLQKENPIFSKRKSNIQKKDSFFAKTENKMINFMNNMPQITAKPQNLVEINDLSKLKIAVCTIYIGKRNRFYDECITSIERFAYRNNHHFHIIKESSWYPHPSWERLRFKQLFDDEDYDALLYIDGDVFTKYESLNPVKYYPLDGITALNSYKTYSYMRPMCTNRANSYKRQWKKEFNEECPFEFPNDRMINAGVMIIPRSCRDFLNDPPRILSDSHFYEQTYLNCNSLNYKYYEMDLRWNVGHVNKVANMKLAKSNYSCFIHFNTPANIDKLRFLQYFQDKTIDVDRKDLQKLNRP